AGSSFEDAVAHAQAIGIAETDPSGDVLGWDAAVKVAALTTVLMDYPLQPSEVERKGIEDIRPEMISQAGRQGRRWKLICQGEPGPDGIKASVAPEALGEGDPMYSVMGSSSAITFWSDVLGALTVAEVDPGPMSTAYGLLADTISAVRNM
ncbi:MAG: homoserine dehydrogenase, partial [Anaerolineales bacterium]